MGIQVFRFNKNTHLYSEAGIICPLKLFLHLLHGTEMEDMQVLLIVQVQVHKPHQNPGRHPAGHPRTGFPRCFMVTGFDDMIVET